MRHPNVEFARKTIEKVISRRAYSEWKIDNITFQFFPSQYLVQLSKGEESVIVPVISEFLEAYEQEPTSLVLRRIKRVVKEKIRSIMDDEE